MQTFSRLLSTSMPLEVKVNQAGIERDKHINKKGALPQGNRPMLQLFRSVFTAVLLHFLFQFL